VSTTPPSIPGDVLRAEGPNWTAFWSEFWRATFEHVPSGLELSKESAGGFVAEIAAWLIELSISITAEIGKRIGEGTDEWEAQAGPTILRAAARGVSDYFGVDVSPSQLDPARSTSSKFDFAEQLGRLVLENMFGAFTVPQSLNPDVGRQNAERMLGFSIATALESFIGQVTAEAPLMRFIPNWADLDDLLSQNLGLGRANRRVIGPLLKTLVVDPFTWDLNRRFAPHKFSPSELLRLKNRRIVDDGEFEEQMSWMGFSKEASGRFQVLNTTYPGAGDISRMLELTLISEEQAKAIFQAQGFSETGSAAMVTLAKEDRVRSINTAMESVGRDMYRGREIDEPELRSILQAAGRAPGEIDAFLGLAQLERSRPRELPRGDVEDGFRRGLIPLSRLREYYSHFGYSLDDQVLLEEMAVEDRIAAEAREKAAKLAATGSDFRAVPRGQIEGAYVEGLIPASRLRDYYAARLYSGDDVALLMDLASRRKTEFDRARAEELARARTPQFLQMPKASVEEAFIRDVIDAGRLREWYEAQPFAPGDIPVLLATARQKKAEREERLAEELKRANRPDFTELPRSVMEEAFIRSIVSEGRLLEWYQAQGFRDVEIPVLLELARQRKAAAAAKVSSTAPKPTA
jgi:hypothetical protein